MNRLHRTIMNGETGLFPVWYMRQAGRYLPEYMEIKNKSKGFLDMCLTPETAKTITLQPMERFDLDAAIIFSDILVIPWAMGQGLVYNPGPKLDPLDPAVFNADIEVVKEKLKPVYEAIKLVRKELHEGKSLIGFAGAPWTLLRYMMSGSKSNANSPYTISKNTDPASLDQFDSMFRLEKLSDLIVMHLSEQIKAGCDIVQIFDSWAGELGEDYLIDFCYTPTAYIVEKLKKEFPNVPIIGYPRDIGKDVIEFCHRTGVDVISISSDVDPKWAMKHLPNYTVQGGMDPEILTADPSLGKINVLRNALWYLRQFENSSYIFNLGGGIIKTTDPKTIETLTNCVKQNREFLQFRKATSKKANK